MQIRVLTLKFSCVLDGFDDEPLREFVKDKEVLSIHDHFFVKDGSPYLVDLVTYNLLRHRGSVEEEMDKGPPSEKMRRPHDTRPLRG